MKYKPQVANTRLFNFAVLTKLVILHFVDDFMNFNYRKTTISVMPSKNTTNTVTPTCIPVLNTVMDTKSRVSSQFLSVIFQEMSSSLLGLNSFSGNFGIIQLLVKFLSHSRNLLGSILVHVRNGQALKA